MEDRLSTCVSLETSETETSGASSINSHWVILPTPIYKIGIQCGGVSASWELSREAFRVRQAFTVIGSIYSK